MANPAGHPEQTALETRLGHAFARPELLAAALTHRSHAAENGQPDWFGGQRLEFLGDAVLGAIAAEWLVARREEWREGTLTKVRSRLTNTAALARVARRLELGGSLRLGRGEEQGGGREREALLADGLEAVFGALWLDGGPGAVRAAFEKWFAEELDEALAAGGDDNPKGELQERLQRERQAHPRYELTRESGPAHARHFQVDVFLGDEPLGRGVGASKREAETRAAREALRRLGAGGNGSS